MTSPTAPVRDRLRAALGMAMKARDRERVSALRSALARIENAEAVPLTEDFRAGAVENAALGAGAADAARRDLSEREQRSLVQAEADEADAAAAQVESLDPDRADRLRRTAADLRALVCAG